MGERIQVSNLFSIKQNSTLKVIFPNQVKNHTQEPSFKKVTYLEISINFYTLIR